MSGSLCISIDLELAWGIWDKPAAAYHERCAARERAIVDGLLRLFADHDVPATWAIVGKLLERDPAPPSATAHGERIWYAPQLIDAITAARPAHEIGSHSHAHLYFHEATRDALRADLAAARETHARHGLAFRSFVFPRNQVGHLDLLREAGIEVFRSVDDGWYVTARQRLGATAGRLANLADKALPIPPRAVAPIDHGGGLVELPSSMLLLSRNGLRRLVRPSTLVAKARLGLAAARRTGGVFHLWFHPSNFYYDTERQLAVLGDILARAADLRARGELAIRTMGSFASGSPAA